MNMHAILALPEANPFDPRSRDFEFWAAYDAYKVLCQQFEDDKSEDDEIWDDYGRRISDARLKLVDADVSTFSAIWAKLLAVQDVDHNDWRPGVSLRERVSWDAGRLIKLELLGEAASAVFLGSAV